MTLPDILEIVETNNRLQEIRGQVSVRPFSIISSGKYTIGMAYSKELCALEGQEKRMTNHQFMLAVAMDFIGNLKRATSSFGKSTSPL